MYHKAIRWLHIARALLDVEPISKELQRLAQLCRVEKHPQATMSATINPPQWAGDIPSPIHQLQRASAIIVPCRVRLWKCGRAEKRYSGVSL